MDTKLRNVLIIGILIISLAVAYHYVIYIPNRDTEERTRADEEKVTLATELDNCLTVAENIYNADWNQSCKTSGADKKTDGCRLPSATAQVIEDRMNTNKDNCFKQYK